ncbi:MAG TPA: DUF4388 domain-containing protein [Acidimicrobiia bacterium]|nr:DUF4388 domain-containing protein [Acidimicrobiia bacterium]
MKDTEGKMHLSGQLSDWSINDLLQIMQVTKKTGSLDIEGQRHGRVHFREGRVTGAELTGAQGAYNGIDRAGVADILYVLSTVAEGSFAVGAADGPDTKGWTVEEVLLDVEALQSLEGEVVASGLLEASAVKLVPEIGAPVTIEPEDWQVFVNLVPTFTFDALESRYGRGGAVRIFHTLQRLDLADMVTIQEGETDWLDRLAEGVAPGSTGTEWSENGGRFEPEAPRHPTEEPEDIDLSHEVDEPDPVVEPAPITLAPDKVRTAANLKGVSAPASTTLTDGVYDEIRRLRSRVGEK